MPDIILNARIVADDWSVVRLTENEAALIEGNLIVPLSIWQARKTELLARAKRGVWLAPHEDAAAIADDLPSLNVIAIDFPQFTDGRGFSIAALLRTRLGWQGELRAIGEVLRDQLFYLNRVGFNSYAMREDQDLNDAVKGLIGFSETYQASTDQPLPLFRRRA
jgi:uncharacterized protein (DUF934 family)